MKTKPIVAIEEEGRKQYEYTVRIDGKLYGCNSERNLKWWLKYKKQIHGIMYTWEYLGVEFKYMPTWKTGGV